MVEVSMVISTDTVIEVVYKWEERKGLQLETNNSVISQRDQYKLNKQHLFAYLMMVWWSCAW